jgi:hypothetical protein
MTAVSPRSRWIHDGGGPDASRARIGAYELPLRFAGGHEELRQSTMHTADGQSSAAHGCRHRLVDQALVDPPRRGRGPPTLRLRAGREAPAGLPRARPRGGRTRPPPSPSLSARRGRNERGCDDVLGPLAESLVIGEAGLPRTRPAGRRSQPQARGPAKLDGFRSRPLASTGRERRCAGQARPAAAGSGHRFPP